MMALASLVVVNNCIGNPNFCLDSEQKPVNENYLSLGQDPENITQATFLAINAPSETSLVTFFGSNSVKTVSQHGLEGK